MTKPKEGTAVSTGGTATLVKTYEDREIIIAQGLEFHTSDIRIRNDRLEQWATEFENGPSVERYREIVQETYAAYKWRLPADRPSQQVLNRAAAYARQGKGATMHEKLRRSLGDRYVVNSETSSEYTSDVQKVHFIISIVQKKTEFRASLEREGIMVVYDGHARWGRGPCFEVYADEYPPHGDQWENGTNNDNGLFRMGYPFLPIGLSDIKHHQYQFRPVRAEDPQPPIRERHPQARVTLRAVTLPEDLRGYVAASYRSPSHRYWGLTRERESHLLLQAGWTDTVNRPFDLDATDLRCKCFCHFGCSTRVHNWEIVRNPDYKGWVRPKPPIDRFAYFTTAPSDSLVLPIWSKYWLQYPHQNNHLAWWESLRYAKRMTNIELTSIRAGYQVY